MKEIKICDIDGREVIKFDCDLNETNWMWRAVDKTESFLIGSVEIKEKEMKNVKCMIPNCVKKKMQNAGVCEEHYWEIKMENMKNSEGI